MPNVSALVSMISVTPPGFDIVLGLLGDAKYEPAANASSGGWQIVDRPRLVAATQWYDRAPWQMTIDVMLAYNINGNNGTDWSIEFWCNALESFTDRLAGAQQPPVFALSGPIPGTQHQWVIYNLAFAEAVRDNQGGYRTQQKATLTLYEYNSPLSSVVGNPTPAQAATAALNSAEASQAYTLYTVVAGDNLVTIAANILGNYTFWVGIADINNIRDPDNVVPGQVLKIPQGF